MNPFNWAGPSFLVFYTVLGAALVAAFWVWTRSSGPELVGARMSQLTSDPYKIACLRGGEDEAVRIALFNLVDRGLLQIEGNSIAVLRPDAAGLVTRALDRTIITEAGKTTFLRVLLNNLTVKNEASAYVHELARSGLVASEEQNSTRFKVKLAAIGLLIGVAIAKLVVAVTHGHSNVFFLILFTALACYIMSRVGRSTATRAGVSVLSNLRTITGRLQRNATKLRRGGATNDALLLASVFGLGVLPSRAFPFIRDLTPKQQLRTRRDDDDSCGSSCGSGGCCGGGCGGGCGGCGS